MARMARSVKSSFTSLGSSCNSRYEYLFRGKRSRLESWKGDDNGGDEGQGNLEGNTTLVEVAAMSLRALLQPPEGVSCRPVPAEPAVKSRSKNREKQLGGQAERK